MVVRPKYLVLAFIALLSPIQTASAATIATKDGTVVTGEVEALNNGTYTIRTPYGVIKIPAASVKSIQSELSPITSEPATHTKLRLAGSTTIGDELMPALVERYAAANGLSDPHWAMESPDGSEQNFTAKGAGDRTLEAQLSRHGSATAFSALAEGKANIGMASRPVNKEEIEKLRRAGFGEADAAGQEHVLALDGLVILVNRSNPIDRLSIDQLGGIFSGEIKDWSQVGGSPGAIHVLGRDAKSGTADTFKGVVLKTKKIVSGAQLMDSSDGLSDKVAGDPLAIGYAGFAYTRRAKALAIQTACGLESAPNDFFVRTEEYPLSRRLFLYTKAPNEEDAGVHRFVAFALGGDGQEEATQKGFVDLVPRLSPSDYGAARVATALRQISDLQGDTSYDFKILQTFNKIANGGRRVSVTFRFRTASFDLDTRALQDIDRLVAALKTPNMGGGRGLVVLGFSDSQGSPVRNYLLSQKRAERVAGLLRGKGVRPRTVAGLGRTAAVACNTSPDGLEKNRRVEVWLVNQQN